MPELEGKLMRNHKKNHSPYPGQETGQRRRRFSLIRAGLMTIGLLTVLYFLIVYVLMPILARLS